MRRGLCVRAALALGGRFKSSQSGAYAQTAPHSKYAVTRHEVVVFAVCGYQHKIRTLPSDNSLIRQSHQP